jgi:hypothetical protein
MFSIDRSSFMNRHEREDLLSLVFAFGGPAFFLQPFLDEKIGHRLEAIVHNMTVGRWGLCGLIGSGGWPGPRGATGIRPARRESYPILEHLLDEIIRFDDMTAVPPLRLRKRHPHAAKIDVLRGCKVHRGDGCAAGVEQLLQDALPRRHQLIDAEHRQVILDSGNVCGGQSVSRHLFFIGRSDDSSRSLGVKQAIGPRRGGRRASLARGRTPGKILPRQTAVPAC